jgi:D-tyrosyl-tRNA(Tyr) deacylase
MKALIQRVKKSSVSIDGKQKAIIGQGLLILLGITDTDTHAAADWLASKLAQLRVFSDSEGKMNLSLLDFGGEALVVSQFTLYGDARKGNRPSYIQAARPEKAEPLYEYFVAELQKHLSTPVQAGVFGADMQVSLINDGPVTIMIESP